MAELPIKKLVMPSDLAGIENGKLPRKLLTKIAPSGKMHNIAAISWARLQDLAKQEGLELVHVGDYRPYDQQEQLFLSRMKDFPNAKAAKQTTREWRGKTWYG